MGKVIIFSAPSGSGKTTIVRRLLERYPQFEFSISATSRAPRGQERDGVDYYFLSHGEFMQAVAENRFVEWEEVYKGTCYGTLRSEVERIWAKGHVIVFDVDVVGGINLKRIFGDDACSVFIMPPSVFTSLPTCPTSSAPRKPSARQISSASPRKLSAATTSRIAAVLRSVRPYRRL